MKKVISITVVKVLILTSILFCSISFNNISKVFSNTESNHIPVFYDDFNSRSFTSGDWQTTGACTFGLHTTLGYHARINGYKGGATLTKKINTLDYKNIVVSYEVWSHQDIYSFKAEWSPNGQNWYTLETLTGSFGLTNRTYSLPSAANHNPDLQIRFSSMNYLNTYVAINKVDVKGEFYANFNNGLDPEWNTSELYGTFYTSKFVRVYRQTIGNSHITKKVTLIPGKAYVLQADMRYLDDVEVDRKYTEENPKIENGCRTGANIAIRYIYDQSGNQRFSFNQSGLRQNYNSYFYDTDEKPENFTPNNNWQKTSVNFIAPQSGKVEIALGLGYACGPAKGTVYFDNVEIISDTSVTRKDGQHIFTYFHKSDLDSRPAFKNSEHSKWLQKLDKVYIKMHEFVGGEPNKFCADNKIGILSSMQSEVYGLAVAGMPIIWYKQYIPDCLDKIINGDWSFAMMHEIGHLFNIGNDSWNWNDEIFANLRMFYALQKLELEGNVIKVYEDGVWFNSSSELKIGYENKSNVLKQNGGCFGDGIIYRLICISEVIGWQPFTQTFLELTNTHNYGNNYTKFLNFIDTLNSKTNPAVFNNIPQSSVRELIPEEEWNIIRDQYLPHTRIKNVATGQYLHMQNQTGLVEVGSIDPNSTYGHWSIKIVPENNNQVRIKNRETGQYMHIENFYSNVSNNPKAVQTGSIQYEWWSPRWSIVNIGNQIAIKNAWNGAYMYNHTPSSSVKMLSSPNQNTALWILEPLD